MVLRRSLAAEVGTNSNKNDFETIHGCTVIPAIDMPSVYRHGRYSISLLKQYTRYAACNLSSAHICPSQLKN